MRHAHALAAALLAAAPPAAAAECPAAAHAPPLTWRDEGLGLRLDHPPVFVPDPGSVPEGGGSTRFWTPDRRATAVVNAARAERGTTLAQLLREAEGDVVQNAGGEITYRRQRDNWFVLSGYMAGRIFYRRTLLTAEGVAATLWMEFPRDMRPCLDHAVTVMSLSFRGR
ncbi:hypothetical protein [Falsiroseomonas sp. CW058]|uniref:hypothetical protein n=1 Tax=Falsiroseomonas sp. CW058 TaxID=3388664 RepID=UPI003D310416